MQPPARPVRPLGQPQIAAPASHQVIAQRQVQVSSNGEQLERQLDAIIKPTTVEDLARKGGQLKTVKERDLRELIRQSLLQLLQSTTAIAADEQERILDQVQADLRRSMGARASEQAERQQLIADHNALQDRLLELDTEQAQRADELGALHGQLADAAQEIAGLRADLANAGSDAWLTAVDNAYFGGRHRRDAERHGGDAGQTLAEDLQNHLVSCDALLIDYAATPPGSDAASDVLARLRELLARRTTDQSWIAELQKRQALLMTERDGAHEAAEAELARNVQAEERIAELHDELQLLTLRHADQREAQQIVVPAPRDAALEAELEDLRDRVSEAQSRLDDAIAGRTRAERELASAATGKAAAERRLADTEARLGEAQARLRESESQVMDQRRTTDLARLASVEAETQRAEIEGLQALLRERERTLGDERERARGDREKHRADNAQRLEAMRRVEQALVTLKEQLAEREAELAALQAQPPRAEPVLPAAPAVIDRSRELAAVEERLAAAQAAQAAAEAAREDAVRAVLLAEAEVAGLRAHQADAIRLIQERDLLRRALADAEARAKILAAARDTATASARSALAATPVHAPNQVSEHLELAARLDEARRMLGSAEQRAELAGNARRQAEAELAALRLAQADVTALQRERDWLREALLRTAGRVQAPAAKTEVFPVLDAPVAASLPPSAGPVAKAPESAPVPSVPTEPSVAKVAPAPVTMPAPVAVAPRSAIEESSAPVPIARDATQPLPIPAPVPQPVAAVTPAPAPAPSVARAAPTRESAAVPSASDASQVASVPVPQSAVTAAVAPAPAVSSAPSVAAVAAPAASAEAAGVPAATEAPAKTSPARIPEQLTAAGGACLGEDGRARFAYLRGTTPRLAVHGATWHHQGLAVTSAVAGAAPIVLLAGSRPSVLYRDKAGAVHRADADGRATVLPDGSADGEPAVLPDGDRWLVAVRRGAEVLVHAVDGSGSRFIGRVPAAGDPAWIPGGKRTAHHLAVPLADGVVLHSLRDVLGPAQPIPLAPAVSSVAALAVAGRGNQAVIAVRSETGVIAARAARPDGTWSAPVVLDAQGAPAIGRLAAAAADGEAVIAYRSDDGLLQLVLFRNSWRHLAFGTNFRAPPAAGDPQLLLHDRLIRCFYPGTDGHVHEVRNSSAGWNAYDLSVLTRDV